MARRRRDLVSPDGDAAAETLERALRHAAQSLRWPQAVDPPRPVSAEVSSVPSGLSATDEVEALIAAHEHARPGAWARELATREVEAYLATDGKPWLYRPGFDDGQEDA